MKTKHSFWGRYFPLLIILSAIISACDSSTLSGDDPSGGPGGSQGTGWNKDQPNNVILYKTNTGTIISREPVKWRNYIYFAYGENEEVANIVSNTYSEEGIGKIVFDKDLRAIASGAFFNSKYLTSISIPSGVTEIGAHAFEGCSSLTSITFPSSVTTIGDYALEGCYSLISVTILAQTPPLCGDLLPSGWDWWDDLIIYVPSESVDAYKSAWPKYADRDRIQPIQ